MPPHDAMTPHDAISLYNPPTHIRAHTHTHGTPLYGKVASCGVIVSPDALAALAARVSRLGPDRRNPEQFHEDKNEIAAELRRLSRAKVMTP